MMVTELRFVPRGETAADALPVGALALLEARRRRQLPYRYRPEMAFDSAAQYRGGQPALVEQIAEELDGCDAVGVGPLVGRAAGAATATPEVYFAIAAADESGLFTLLAGAADRASAASLRDAVLAGLVREWPPRTVWAVDDELELARWASWQWPDDPIASKLVEAITAERRRG